MFGRTHLLMPAAALVISVVWLSRQHAGISALAAENRECSAAIARTRLADSGDPSFTFLEPLPNKPFDARKVARDYAVEFAKRLAGEPEDPAVDFASRVAMTRFTPADCAAALDELEQLELTGGARNRIRGAMAFEFREAAPDVVCNHYLDLLHTGRVTSIPFACFEAWVEKDATAAAGWLDKVAQAGMFHPRNLNERPDRRVRFETALIRALAVDSPETAEARLANLDEARRTEILTDAIKHESGPGRTALIGMVQRQIPDPAARERIITLPESDD